MNHRFIRQPLVFRQQSVDVVQLLVQHVESQTASVNLITTHRDIAFGEDNSHAFTTFTRCDLDLNALLLHTINEILPCTTARQCSLCCIKDGILDNCLAFESVTVYLHLAIAPVKTVVSGHRLTNGDCPFYITSVRYGLAEIVDSVIDNMHMIMVVVMVSEDDKLGISDAHLLHILHCQFTHESVSATMCVFWRK